MKLLTTLVSISLLQAIYAAFAINILVPDQWKDSARVTGKKVSNGTSMEMYRAKNDPNSSSICPIDTEAQTATGTGCDMTLYFGVTSLHFSEPTTDPRPVIISMSDYDFKVCLKQDKMIKLTPKCQVSVKDPEGFVFWYVSWGLGYVPPWKEDKFEIRCEL